MRREFRSSARWRSRYFCALNFGSAFEYRQSRERICDAQRNSHCGIHSRHFFEHQDIGNCVRGRASLRFRDQHSTAAEFAQLAQFGGREPSLSAVARANRWAHFGVHELTDCVSNQALIVGERKVHCVAGTSDASTMSWEIQQDGLPACPVLFVCLFVCLFFVSPFFVLS